MIRTSQVHHCRACGSTHIVKNGRNRSGSQQYQCRTCGASKVLLSKQRYSEERKAEVLRAYQERSSLRGLSRTFGITRKTITQWLKKLLSLPTVKETLFAAKASDVLELDEAWSFVWWRKNKRWLWTVMCRQEPARSWPSPTATTVRPPAGHFGSGCRKPTASAAASVTSGKPMRRSSRRRLTAVSARRPGRPRTWNAGTTPCASASDASSARPFPSPRKTGGMTE